MKKAVNYPQYAWSKSIAFLFILLNLVVFITPVGQSSEKTTGDFIFRLRQARPTKTKVVVVAVDEATHTLWKDTPIALSAGLFGDVIRKVLAAQASFIGLDVVHEFDADRFLARYGIHQQPNAALVSVLDTAPHRVLLGQIDLESGGSHLPSEEIRFLLEQQPPDIGLLDFTVDYDNTVRRGVLYVNKDKATLPSFGACLAGWVRHINPRDAGQLRQLVDKGFAFDSNVSHFGINFTGRDTPTISASDILRNRCTQAQLALLQDSIVLIADTSAASKDFHRTPFSGNVPGVNIHADIISTLLDECVVTYPSATLVLFILVCIGVTVFGVLLLVPNGWFIPISCLLCLAWWGLAVYELTFNFIILPTLSPSLIFIVTPVICFSVRFIEERLRLISLRSALGPYLSEGICNYLLESDENRRPGGKIAEATCLFLDVRDSVRYATQNPPDAVMRDLNELFQEIVPGIANVGGHVCKYTGDGLLAVFGVPTPIPNSRINHADAGVAALINIAAGIERVNHRRIQQGQEIWRIGCGLNSGTMVYGNLGTLERPEFTLIGDTVNVAARLESLTRVLSERLGQLPPVSAVIGDNTYLLLTTKPEILTCQTEDIRGHGPLKVYLLRL